MLGLAAAQLAQVSISKQAGTLGACSLSVHVHVQVHMQLDLQEQTTALL